jgi:hypothetical protein
VSAPVVGQVVYFHVDFQLKDTSEAVAVSARALLDGALYCSGESQTTPGGWIRWCNAPWSATGGKHTLRWELDYTDSVAERDESNNTVSATWTTPGCVGDCDGNRKVTVDELLTMVNVALGSSQVSACAVGDADSDGEISIDEILRAVNSALEGCAIPNVSGTQGRSRTAVV